MTLRPEEREGIDQVQRSLVGGGEGKHCQARALHTQEPCTRRECDEMQEDQGPCS